MTRILIVDDQAAFRRQFRQLLSLAGVSVLEAQDIAEAEMLVRATSLDLAVVDLMMPGVNGLEGVARLKRLAPTLRVILISAFRDHTDLFRTAARQAGAETFIAKDDLDLDVVRGWQSAETRAPR